MQNPLLIRVYSFSYIYGEIPKDPTCNGGGFVFDCRFLTNPGRVENLRELTGLDKEVIAMLDDSSEVQNFKACCFNTVSKAADNYQKRGFQNLSIAFGCTGGRHRSVYCAESLSRELQSAGYNVRTIHMQMEIEGVIQSPRRGMIFAAGLGTRLRPITDDKPKALVKANGKSMLDHTLEKFNQHNITEIAVNAHHFADQVISWAETNISYQTHITVSYEKELLGTGGGLQYAGRWLHGGKPVLVHNADIWTDFNLEELYAKHDNDSLASVAVQQRESSSYLLVDDENQLCGLSWKDGQRIVKEPKGKVRKMGFSGIHLVNHKLFEHLARKSEINIIHSYLRLIEEKHEHVKAIEMQGNWFDMGSPEKLQKLDEFLRNR